MVKKGKLDSQRRSAYAAARKLLPGKAVKEIMSNWRFASVFVLTMARDMKGQAKHRAYLQMLARVVALQRYTFTHNSKQSVCWPALCLACVLTLTMCCRGRRLSNATPQASAWVSAAHQMPLYNALAAGAPVQGNQLARALHMAVSLVFSSPFAVLSTATLDAAGVPMALAKKLVPLVKRQEELMAQAEGALRKLCKEVFNNPGLPGFITTLRDVINMVASSVPTPCVVRGFDVLRGT